MYKKFFGLKESPFSIAPDPRYLYMSGQHREALAHLVYGVQSDGGFVLLTGEVGTGKTTVCRCFLEHIPRDSDVAFIINPKMSVEELLATVCDELGIRYPEGAKSVKTYVDAINDYLLNAHAKGRKTVLIIEEAQNLSDDVLEQVRLLTNLETNEKKLLHLVMVGQPELRDKLSRPELRQLAQRITARYHLRPLTRDETVAYVYHRVSVAGGSKEIFSPSSIDKLYRLSRGIPRLVNILCDRALLGAYAQGKKQVDRRTLIRAAEEALQDHKTGQRPRKLLIRASLAVACVMVLTVVTISLYSGGVRLPALSAAPSEPALKTEEALSPHSPVDSLRWPPEQPFALSKDMAFQALLTQWNIPHDQLGLDSLCERVQTKGVQCLNAQGSLNSLLNLNRPAVMRLFDDKDREFYATIIALNGQTATVVVGTEKRIVDLKEIAMRWLGDYTLLWRTPSAFKAPLNPGEKGGLVQWLDRQLARIQGRKPGSLKSTSYNETLVRHIKKFQLAEGLVPDGVVGPQTIIHLSTAAGTKEPLLIGKGMEGR